MNREALYVESSRDFAAIEEQSFIRRVSNGNSRMMYILCEYLGWAKGEKLGTDAAAQIIHHSTGWFYDRKFEVVLDCPAQHNQVASHLYACHRDVEWNYADAEKYATEGLGFWKSSVSRQHIYVGPNINLSAQEKLAFRNYIFDRF